MQSAEMNFRISQFHPAVFDCKICVDNGKLLRNHFPFFLGVPLGF